MGKVKALDTALVDAGIQQPCQLYLLPDGSVLTLVNLVDDDGRYVSSTLMLITTEDGVRVLEAI